MFEIIRYTPDKASEWNDFVAHSKNGTFLFDRRYMDYHADRFSDHSLMFFDNGRLYALLPANRVDNVLFSHQGLTYGGLVMDSDCRAAKVRDVFESLNDFLRNTGFHRVVYKHVPYVYATLPSDEDLFALTNVCKASILSRDVASVVDLNNRLPFTTLRRRGVKKAQNNHLQVMEYQSFDGFWQILEDNLQRRFHTSPVHSLSEIELLHGRFPQNVRLFMVGRDGELLGGTVLYCSAHIVKTQYISANETGKRLGALDFLFSALLDKFADEGVRYFDFGTSNLVENDDLNEPLIFQKEGFGGRAVCYDTYEWKL